MDLFKRLFLLLFAFGSLANLRAQDSHARVLLQGDDRAFHNALEAGVCLDHVSRQSDGIVAELSTAEIQAAETAGLSVTTIVPDIESFYAKRAANDVANMDDIAAAPAGFNFGSMGGFLTYHEVLAELDSMFLAHPTLITQRDSIGSTTQGHAIWLVKISDNPDIDESEPEVFYNALHHAREPLSMMQLIYFMQYLLDEYSQNPLVTYLINERELYFIPIVNPDGYLYNQQQYPNGGGMWRKNRSPQGGNDRGVDLNRNYGYGWGHDNLGSSPSTSSNTFRGPAPFSELETQAIHDFCVNRQIATGMSYHCYGEYLVHPWGFDDQQFLPDRETYHDFSPILFEHHHYYPGTPIETVGYPANGVWDDWMYGDQIAKPKAIAYSPEIGNAIDGFWPSPSRILPLCENQLQANLRIATLAGPCVDVHPEIPITLGGTTLDLKVRYQNHGLQPQGHFSTQFITAHPAVTGIPVATATFSGLSPEAWAVVAFQVTVDPATSPGTLISGTLRTTLDAGLILEHPVSFRYGTPDTIFFDDAESGPINWSGTWSTTDEKSYTGSKSFTDSPYAFYAPNAHEPFEMVLPIHLEQYELPMLSFWTVWDLDHATDYVQIEVSSDATNYLPLQGRLSWDGIAPEQPAQEPVYEGRPYKWREERISLQAFEGLDIYLRFKLVSNPWREREGFFFDDILVTGYNTAVNVDVPQPLQEARLIPNPTQGQVRLHTPIQEPHTLQVQDLAGRHILTTTISPTTPIDLTQLSPGIYLYRLTTPQAQSPWQKLALR